MAGRRPPLSLKGRALGFLSRREHSRVELEKKLKPYCESSEQLLALLDELQRMNFLCDDRFIESVVHRRAAKSGPLLLKQALAMHGLDPLKVKAVVASSKATELTTAQSLWEKKFNSAPTNLAEKAKQMRFLASRGFSADVVRKVIPRLSVTEDSEDWDNDSI
jgi:regulatory protein